MKYRSRTPFARRLLAIEGLESRRLLVSDLTAALQNIVKAGEGDTQQLVDAVHDRLFDQILHNNQPTVNLPVIKDALKVKDQPADQLNAVKDKVFNAISSLGGEVDSSAIINALNLQLAGLVRPGMPITATCGPSVQPCQNGGPWDSVNLMLHLGGTVVEKDTPFDLGLSKLLTPTAGQVHAKLTYEADLILGFSVAAGVYLDTAPNNDMRMSLNVTTLVPPLSGQLGFFRFTATNPGPPSIFQATYTVQMLDGGDPDSLLPVAEIGAMQFNGTRSGAVTFSPRLTFDMGDAAFPSLGTNLQVGWVIDGPLDAPLTTLGQVPTIAFNHVTISAGSFFTNFVQPIAQKLDNALGPLDELVDVLTTRIPVLSDLAPLRSLICGSCSEVTPLTFLGLPSDSGFVAAFRAVNAFIDAAGAWSTTGDVELGSFTLAGDVRSIASLSPALLNNVTEVNLSQGPFAGFLNSLNGTPLQFTLLTRPRSAFEILVGGDAVEIFKLDMPTLEGRRTIKSPTIPILGPLGIWLEGSLGAKLDVDFGYDSFGLKLWSMNQYASIGDVFEGFYIVDGPGNEAELEASITAYGGVDLVLVQFGVGGGVIGRVGLDLRDPNNDGRIRPREISQNLAIGPLCMFDFSGSLGAKLSVYAKFGISIFSVEFTIDLFEVELVSFDFPCNGTNTVVPWASLDPDTRELTLNTGPRSVIPGFLYDENGVAISGIVYGQDETVNISKIGTDEPTGLDILQVEVFGVKQVYTGVRSIYAEGGSGRDVIQIDSNVRAPATLYGGFADAPPIGSYIDGDDVLVVGGGGGEVHGGSGYDEIGGGGGYTYNNALGQPVLGTLVAYGDDGDDILHGSRWADILSGGDGNDRIFGGLGDDILAGNLGEDLLFGDEGNDLLLGHEGSDDLRGGPGDDELHGGDPDLLGFGGNDFLRGGEGNNRLYGDGGDDQIDALSGMDLINGGAGADLIDSGTGNDTVYGGDGDDDIFSASGQNSLYGEGGNDRIQGGQDFDVTYGGSGNDVISDFGGGTWIFGDDGDDWLSGSDENDILRGGSGNDVILAHAGVDTIYGDEGNDIIRGGLGNDSIEGRDGNDEIHGDEGNDSISGGNGHDLLHGGADDDLVYGSTGDDTLYGDAGQDGLVGNDGNDTIYGGTENDILLGDNGLFVASVLQPTDGTGNDTIYGEDGNDLIYGQDGGDAIEAGNGFDTVFAGAGIDVVHGGAEDDLIYGEAGDDWLWGEAGADLLDAGAGWDLIYGGTGSDRAYGQDGNDTIYGHAPLVGDDNTRDYLHGGAGNDTLEGQGGDDYLNGDVGIDILRGGVGNDTLLAGSGIGDQLFGDDGDDQLVGSDDGSDVDPDFNDSTYFGDVLDGGNGDDTIRGLSGADAIVAGAGKDWVDSGPGGDRVRGGDGDDYLYAGRGIGDSIDGEAGNDTIDGSHEGNDLLAGGPGQDQIHGQGGNDTLLGDADDDHLDGGTGTDNLQGGTGHDTLIGGGGVGDQLDGGAGNDVLHGSEDGADLLQGGPGRDSLYGRGGNDSLAGGDGDDLLDGGAGDDTVTGDGGADALVGGANHDILYGHSISAAGDDNAVDDLYGDFGTADDEADSGRDRLYGQGGNDRLWGEGDDDFIDGGSGTSNQIDFGSGEGPVPSDFVSPTPTPPPPVQPGIGISHAGERLPDGVDTRGYWSELAGSGSGNGVSRSPSSATESSVAMDNINRRYVAWADSRAGNFEIYVARHVPGVGWQSLPTAMGTSAAEGGISNTAGSSRQPQVAIDEDGNPIVAWTEILGTTKYIYVLKFDPAAAGGNGDWLELGGSASGVGISGTGFSDSPKLVVTSAGPVVAWLDASSGSQNVYVKRFSGGAWMGLGGAAYSSGTGLSQSAVTVPDFAIATDGTKVSIAWTQSVVSGSQVYLREFNGSTWNALASSFTGGGLSNVAGTNRTPTVAYHTGQLFVAWQGTSQSRPEIHAKYFDGAVWATPTPGLVVSPANGIASQPILSSRGGKMTLAFVDDHRRADLPDATIVTMQWGVNQFRPFLNQLHAPATISAKSVESLSVVLDSAGRASLTWVDPGTTTSQVYLRADLGPSQWTTYYPVSTVQNLLDGPSFGVGDLIYVDVSTPGFTIGPDDSGVTIIAKPGVVISGPVVINGANNVTLQGITTQQLLTINGGQGNSVRDSHLLGGVLLNGSTDTQLIGNWIECDGVEIRGAARPIVEGNSILASIVGVELKQTSSTDVMVRRNSVQAITAIRLSTPSSGTIVDNDLQGVWSGLTVLSPFTGAIRENAIHGALEGVTYSAAAPLDHNRIYGNTTGVATSVGSTITGFGHALLPGNIEPRANEIFANIVGVRLSAGGVVQGQRIRENSVGVQGTGSLLSADFDHANRIENNGLGVDVTGNVQFNYLGGNTTGLLAHSQQIITHNFVYRSAQLGIDVSNATAARIISNTLYAPTVDAVRVRSNSREIEFTNNLVWAEAGFALHVADDSQFGFWSDYNLLHAGTGGTLVHWSGYDFKDILDWQADVAEYDLHSRGRTTANPNWSEPRFVDAAMDNFLTIDALGGQRYTQPNLDSGDPRTDLGIPAAAPANLLTNGGFSAGFMGWMTNASANTSSSNPAAFDGNPYFRPGDVAVGYAEQTVDLVANGFSAQQLDSGDFVVAFSGRLRTADETLPDRGKLAIKFLTAAGGFISERSANASQVSTRWELVGDRVAIPVGTRQITYRFEADRATGTANDAILDAAALRVHSDSLAHDIGALDDYQASATESSSVGPHLAIRFPDLYDDWVRDQGKLIRWESYGNNQELPVRIDLYQDSPHGPSLVTNIVASTADDGEYAWSPGASGIAFGTHGLRLQIQLVGDELISDRSTEPFSVPENTNEVYVNDRSATNDQYSTAAGSNRSTGRLASGPKPLPTTATRVYTIGSGQTLYVDHGSYRLFHPLLVSNSLNRGDDEGFTIAGPTTLGRTADLIYGNPLSPTTPAIELDDADFVTIRDIHIDGGKYGLWVHSGSDHLVVNRVSVTRAALDGIRFEPTISGSTLDQVTSTANGGFGIYVNGPLNRLADSDSGFNQNSGIHLLNPGSVVLEGNQAHDNRGSGIYLQQFDATPITVGNINLSLSRGNVVRDNAGHGIDARGNVLVAGNTVRGHRTTASAGIYLDFGTARHNVVAENHDGIVGGALSTGNRVYQNANVGIYQNGGMASDNVVYSNAIGLELVGANDVRNNLVYANSQGGIRVRSGAALVNNTVYQTLGNAIMLHPQASNVQLRNNVIWVTSGYGIQVPTNSQIGFQSDYNLVHATGNGRVGEWQGIDRATLAAWQGATFQDQNSLSQDPRFVDADGADNFLGFANATNDGRDDDFHEQSLFGSFHGGSLAPVISLGGGVIAGLPLVPTGTLTNDANQSVLIDRGFGLDPFGNELLPSGGFINLGAYGNTSQSSISPTQYVSVMRPDGGELLPAGQSFAIRWRSHDSIGNVKLELLDPNNAVTTTIVASTPNDGEQLWNIPTGFTVGNYRVQVTRLDAGSASDTSNGLFTISPPVSRYYVNDSMVHSGDWTTAPGNDANDGLTPATPKATLRALLDAYDFGPADTIRIDDGTYVATTNTFLTPDDSGVTIEGYRDAAFPARKAILSRGATVNGSYTLQFTGADDVMLKDLFVTGGEYGIVALSGAGSDRITIRDSEIYGNSIAGIYIDGGNDAPEIIANRIYNHAQAGIQVFAANGSRVRNNIVHDMTFGTGIEVRGAFGTGVTNLIAGNESYNNTYNILATSQTGSVPVTLDNNNVYGGRFLGIQALGGNVLVLNNLVHDNSGPSNATGVVASQSAVVQGNQVYGNYVGIYAVGATIRANRVYHNLTIGISESSSTIEGNLVYSNAVGIQTSTGVVRNNLVYANSTDGIQNFFGGVGGRIEQNTVYQPGSGNAIRIGGFGYTATNVIVKNNILSVNSGFGIHVDLSGEIGFTSDYNDLHTTGTGKIGRFGNRDFTSLSDWFYELGLDQHSQTSDPQFVDMDGPDNQLGFVGATDFGLDDNFRVLTGSPTIDAGDPGSAFANEPAPQGGRTNLGYTGNSVEATTSSAQFTQVLSPNGLEKFERGQQVAVTWRTSGIVGGTVSIDLMAANGGASVLAITTATANDGTEWWTIPVALGEGDYRIRVTANQGVQPSDVSDAAFQVVNTGQDYYVNDNSTASDIFTTAVGNNANDGKSSARPMASLTALLAAYDLEPGDVIHVDTGTYLLSQNIVLSAQDSGVRIEGPNVDAGVPPSVLLNRGNTAQGSYVIQLTGADDVTLANLGITGGQYGIVALSGADSDRLTVTNCEVYGQLQQGIYASSTNDDLLIANCQIHDNPYGGVYVEYASGPTVRDSRIFNTAFSTYGLQFLAVGGSAVVSGNEAFGSGTGIFASAQTGGTAIVSGNDVHDNRNEGIRAGFATLVVDNAVYRTRTGLGSGAGAPVGILANSGSIARNNVVFDNKQGIYAFDSTASGNRIFHNDIVGLQGTFAAQLERNTIYSNGVGVMAHTFNGQIANNLIYDNANDGIWLAGGAGARIDNNTIYQPTSGDSIQVGGPHPEFFISNFAVTGLSVSNNIFGVSQGYALNVSQDSTIGLLSDYNDFVPAGTGKIARWEDHEFTNREDWFFELGMDQHGMQSDPQFVDMDGADNVLGYDTAAGEDRGTDDDFRVGTGSPTIDAGDPRQGYVAEPTPNGGRVNLGHTGDTAHATASPAQLVHVLSPNGWEKFEVGQPVQVDWQSSGLGTVLPVALIDAGGGGAESWIADKYKVVGQTFSFTTPVDLGGVTNPAPASTYQIGTYGGFGVGNRVAYQLPAADGNYSLRLHFVEPSLGAGQRPFDIRLNGVTVRSNFDIFTAAGGAFKATTLTFNTSATSGQGISLEMVNTANGYGAYVTGIELTAANPLGVASPTVNVQVSSANGLVWNTVATNVPLDRYGRGSHVWTPTDPSVGNAALIRIVPNVGSVPADLSDAPFLVANAARDYYVNDASTLNDTFTNVAGNNLASGKTPDEPMASLAGLLAAYDLDPADIIHVDRGTYRLYRNLKIGAQDSGMRMEGPDFADTMLPPVAILNRGNALVGNYVIEMTGADDVTIDRLGITGATIGIAVANGVHSDRLTLSNNDIYGNTESFGGNVSYGILVDQGNDDAWITGNAVHNNIGSTNFGTGIYVAAPRARLENNELFGQSTGIATNYNGSLASTDWILVQNNTLHDHSAFGIDAFLNALVIGNTAYSHYAMSGAGIRGNQVTMSDNRVFDNHNGILSDRSTASQNRVYRNAVGIRGVRFGRIENNQVYSNAIGISGDGFDGEIVGNLVYSNTNQGIFITQSFVPGMKIVNNTVYQAVGDAIRLENVSQGSTLRNNIASVDTGYAIYVAANSQVGFSSNYNLLYKGSSPSAHVGFWGGANRSSLSDWQTATGQDANGASADPQWVDRDGPDNVLGYATSGGGYNGGVDDNFHLQGGSPAIDRADSGLAPTLDRNGFPRRDDPGAPNLGIPGTLPFVDLGADEFQGSTSDVIPPTIVSSTIRTVGTSGLPDHEVQLTFSEPLDAIGALSSGHYELRAAGTNNIFGDGDDVLLPLFPQYLVGSTRLALSVVTNGAALPMGQFRLTVRESLYDASGIALDGDANGSAGGDYVRINGRPDLATIADQIIQELEPYRFTANASDDSAVSYALGSGAPAGASIDPHTGVFTWTPTEAQGPGTFQITIIATDTGAPVMNDLRTFTLTVAEVNTAPVIDSISDKTVVRGNLLTFPVTANDADSPANSFAFSLAPGAPAGATIDPMTGVFRWTPSATVPQGHYDITVQAGDNGSPSLIGIRTFRVTVYPIPVALGDFNHDGLLTLSDVDALFAQIASGTHPSAFDLTGDGLVNLSDRDIWLALAGAVNLPSANAYRLGDANLDGVVDGSDFGIWNANKFTAQTAWSRGNFSGDSFVDGSDFGIWNANKFTSALRPDEPPTTSRFRRHRAASPPG